MFDETVEQATGSPLKSERYVLKLLRLEASDHPEYGPGVKWIFNVMEPKSMTVIRSETGENYEWWQTTGTAIRAPKPGGKASRQYRMACAFLNRAIQVGESGREIAEQLPGKYAEAFLGPNDRGNLTVMTVDPIGTNYPQIKAKLAGGNGKTAAVAPPPPAPEPQPEEELVF